MSEVQRFVGPPAESDPGLWSEDVTAQVLELLKGDCLGAGIGRAVFTIEHDPSLVMKVETTPHSFQNVYEWQTWNEVSGTPAEKWFAPCRSISSRGQVLIQERTTPIPHTERPKVPDWLDDLGRANFGYLAGRVVCHDYGLLSMTFSGRPKLVPVED